MKHARSILFLFSLVGGIILLAVLQPAASGEEAPRANVLLIISDDLRPDLGSYGNRLMRTPHIDGLASRGVRFDRAYAQYPLCNPSRASLLTGRYPTSVGVLDNVTWFRASQPFVSLPQYFQSHGYATLRSGKIFHGGMDHAEAWTEGGQPRRFTGPRRKPTRGGPSRAAHSDRFVVLDGDGEDTGDYRVATQAIGYLEEYKDRNAPFFLAVGFSEPHSPPTAPRRFFELYDLEDIELPPDFAARPAPPPGHPEPAIRRRNADLFIGRDGSPEEAREMIRAYYASVSFMDAQVGRVLVALERLGLSENTIVVFFGDHGYHLGEKGKWSKAYSLYEIGVRVPFIIARPGAAARVSPRTVQLVDLFPTLAELTGLPPPADMEGNSLVPLLRDPRAPWPHPAFAETLFEGKLGRSVHTERWHYAEWDDGQAGAMLFDLYADPHERTNLAAAAAHARTVQEMKVLLSRLPAAE